MSQKLQTNDGQPAVQSATFCLSLLIGLLAVASPGLSSFFPPPAVFGWGCPPCNRSHCPPTTCDESLQHADECGCCALCGKLEEEACGGQGNAGGSCNGSGLHCAYRLGSIFGEEGFGICEKSLCQRRLCGYRQRCKVVVGDDGRDSTLCSCDHFLCDHKCNPVCGRDDKTYSSICHLQLAECLSGRPIGIRHFSQCKVVCPPKPKKVYSNLYSAPTPIYCIHEEEMYSPFHILPPTSRNPCTYHVCSGYGHMEQYPVPGCEGTPPEEDWKVEEAVIPASWTEWSPYSSCVGNCEKGGWANRTRTCTAPPPSSHVEAEASAVYCQGEAEESKLCEPEGCRSESVLSSLLLTAHEIQSIRAVRCKLISTQAIYSRFGYVCLSPAFSSRPRQF
ncbi:hypothetical protein GBAR_LOCUS17197 [Geodia barretti]|uniref:IGFBP N-terminal domain-containing protein n=1 Tax=Geodia barretti TaxID=519541 RepID=A0AA35SJI9_GEOBA|nr:hypothetical protein GBAR_LOCUS17197 [Geodia barretti]